MTRRGLPVAAAALFAALLAASAAVADDGLGAAGDPQPVLASAGEPADAGAVSAASPDPRAEAPAAKPACRFRDPEDGRCYESADAADRAWLSRASGPAPNHPAPMLRPHPTVLSEVELPLEDDPDDSDSEDGGALAPVDPRMAGPASAPDAAAGSPARFAFLRNLARSVRGLLVVRKVDSRPPVSLPEAELAMLFTSDFPVPVLGFPPERLKDSFLAPRGRHRRHNAIDLGAPKGTPIIAVADGTIERLGRDRRGGKVVYLRDATGKLLFYYAHLSRHAEGLAVGDRVKKGDVLGEVGSTGRVIGGPHLHFAIFCDVDGGTTPAKGLAINPYVVFTTLIPR